MSTATMPIINRNPVPVRTVTWVDLVPQGTLNADFPRYLSKWNPPGYIWPYDYGHTWHEYTPHPPPPPRTVAPVNITYYLIWFPDTTMRCMCIAETLNSTTCLPDICQTVGCTTSSPPVKPMPPRRDFDRANIVPSTPSSCVLGTLAWAQN